MSSPKTVKVRTQGGKQEPASAASNVFSGGGEMGALMRALDWSKTPVGRVSDWPQSLKTAVRIILTSRYAMFVWWGRELVNLYNDPYRAFLGIKHPEALGKSARQVWAEIWDQIGPRADAVLLRGESTYDEALLLLMERHGYLEETYFTFSYSPLPDDKGDVGGLFCAVTEETQQVIGDRRLRLLREIASAMGGARTPDDVCESAAQCLVKARRDLPFSLIYLVEEDGNTLRRAALAGIEASHPAAPETLNLHADGVWPFRRVIEEGEVVLVEDLDRRFTKVPRGEWDQPAQCAVLLPISQQGNPRPVGVLVAAVNPYRKFDDEFRGFASLLANQIAAAIATAVAYEKERQRAETLAELDKVQARRAIQENELRLRLAQTAAQIGTWEWDPVRSTSRLSPELHAMFGTSADDREHAEKWAARVHRDDWDKAQKHMQEGQRSGEIDFEYRYLHPDQGLRWFYCKGRRNPGEAALFGIVQDITERKEAEEAIRQTEEEFRALANVIPQLVWMANADGWIFWYNQRWYEYTGTAAEQMEGWGWRSVHEPEQLPRVMKEWTNALSTGQPFEMTFPLRGADGVFRPFLTRAVPIRDHQGRITRWFGTNTDISGEVEIQEQLRDREERLRTALLASQKLAAIVESSDDAIVSKDLRGIVTSWNPCAERMFGYTAEEMIGRSITTIIPPELLSDEERILGTIARGDRIDHFETVRVKKNGERIDVSLTISPVKDDTGKIIGAAKIARDITQRRKAERALHTSERLASVGRLAATVAHEINNPLEAVTNLIYLAKEDAVQPEVRAHLAAAEEELERISHLTKQTLGFYRETKGATRMRLSSTVKPLLSVFASKTRSRDIEIQSEIKDDPEIQAVPGEMRQLLANLLSNSIDALDGGGRIRIRVSSATEWNGTTRSGVRLTVADSGAGIPVTDRSRLFEPFFTTKKEVGTGLGLWVCKSIVEKHHGTIRVKSSTLPGRSGTAFSVFLPLQAKSAGIDAPLRKAV